MGLRKKERRETRCQRGRGASEETQESGRCQVKEIQRISQASTLIPLAGKGPFLNIARGMGRRGEDDEEEARDKISRLSEQVTFG